LNDADEKIFIAPNRVRSATSFQTVLTWNSWTNVSDAKRRKKR